MVLELKIYVGGCVRGYTPKDLGDDIKAAGLSIFELGGEPYAMRKTRII